MFWLVLIAFIILCLYRRDRNRKAQFDLAVARANPDIAKHYPPAQQLPEENIFPRILAIILLSIISILMLIGIAANDFELPEVEPRWDQEEQDRIECEKYGRYCNDNRSDS